MEPLTASDPHRLGRYWLAGRLGAGGQGVVYEAYAEPGERVAIKVPRFDSAESRARLAKEAAAAQRVASFCTARVIEAQVEEAPMYIVSEYVPGRSLRRTVAEAGPYRGDALHRLAVGVATALTAIHRAGVVHRDLKPDNIILGPDGPRVIDFGVARDAGPTMGAPTTGGPMVGTPNYMAPEVFEGRGAGRAADLWAWGLVVLFAARGADAVAPGDPMSVLARVLGHRPDVTGLPEPLAGLVAAALARDPAARPAAEDVLRRLLGGGGHGEQDDPLARGGTLAGALKGAPEPDLGEIAEELYGQLTESERAGVPDVFLRMLDGDALRRAERDELPAGKDVDTLLDLFAAAGIVTRSGTGWTLAAPGVLRAWPRLRDWVDANRAGLPVHRRIADAAAVWHVHGRRPADLLHGTHLDHALQWAATGREDLTLTPRERDFLDAAARQARRRVRQRGVLAATLAVLLVLALGGLGAAEYLRRQSDARRTEAQARELALRAADLREAEPEAAGLLAVAAWRLAPGLPETRGALYEARSAHTTHVAYPRSPAGLNRLSLDGRRQVSIEQGQATITDVAAGRPLQRLRLAGLGDDGPARAALSPDGRTLAVQGGQGVRLWDITTGHPRGGWFATEAGKAGNLGRLDFDATGRLLSVPSGPAGEVVWNVAAREQVRTPGGGAVTAVSPDGRLGFVADGSGKKAELWDLRRGERLPAGWLPRSGAVTEAGFSDDGRRLATVEEVPGALNPVIRLFSLEYGNTTMIADGGQGQALAFVFGGRYLALWSDARQLEIRRLADGERMLRKALPEFAEQIRFDTGGQVVRVVDVAGTVTTLDVSYLFDRSLTGFEDSDLLLSPSARVLAVKRHDRLELLDPATGRPLVAPLSSKGSSSAMTFSPDGARLFLADGRKIRVVEVGTGRVTSEFEPADRRAVGADGLSVSPDGRKLLIRPSSPEGTLPPELRDLERGTASALPGQGTPEWDFLPRGRALAWNAPAHVIDVETGAEVPVSPEASRIGGVFAVTRDGRRIVFSGLDSPSVWDGTLTKRIGSFPYLPDSDPQILTWSPDGSLIAGLESGPRIRLWDPRSMKPVGIVFDGLTDDTHGAVSLTFSPDGERLLSLTGDGVLRTFDLDERRVAAAVCERAGRRLTAGEWRTYLPGVEPFDVCRPPGSGLAVPG
ncbi:serine/threonine-protein kinase [Actinomadura sp. ATCC 31491]|uniref:Serine/threonine-protein kinase n=1 Tax=Actinomadura luzonensis TaxID=2805427 RepID=A0ABT0G184_9ACTN|nr:serine/threonine-protein kinase [Actinomadura luzonensis]MCK2218379.1 serine/threonine-protein kinase [Actinomadura luzonensis]